MQKTKRAGEIAAAVEREIIERGWPASEVIGSETELVARHGVSRSVFREAVRILEHRSVARMRPGPGGGLVVTVPDEDVVSSAADLYLTYRQATTRQLFETRKALELSAVENAVRRLDETSIERLRGRLRYEGQVRAEVVSGESSPSLLEAAMRGDEFHTLIAELTGNPATELFVRTLSQVTWNRYRRHFQSLQLPLAPSHRVHDHEEIVEAMVGGDAGLARHRMQRHLDELESLFNPLDGEEG